MCLRRFFSFRKNRHLIRYDPSDGRDPYEVQAEAYLKAMGFTVIDRNYRTRSGEIDLIVSKKDAIRFVEVKGRKSTRHGHPAEFVSQEKQRRICQAAIHYAQKNRILSKSLHFDVITIIGKKISRYENAFELLDVS